MGGGESQAGSSGSVEGGSSSASGSGEAVGVSDVSSSSDVGGEVTMSSGDLGSVTAGSKGSGCSLCLVQCDSSVAGVNVKLRCGSVSSLESAESEDHRVCKRSRSSRQRVHRWRVAR